MKDKLRMFWFYFTTALAALLGAVAFYASRKDKHVKEINDDVNLIKTVKESDVMEAEINRLKREQEHSKKMLQELDKAQERVQERRSAIEADVKNMSPAEITKYWENN